MLDNKELFIKTNVFDVVFSGKDNPICPPGLLGIVLRKDRNEFVRQNSLIIIYENNKFSEFFQTDIGEDKEFILTVFNTPLLKGSNFSNDNAISSAIKQKAFDLVFKYIRDNIDSIDSID
jgi:hypothetical protein